MNTSFTYQLIKPIKIQNSEGQLVDAKSLMLSEPALKHEKQVIKLRHIITKAFFEISKNINTRTTTSQQAQEPSEKNTAQMVSMALSFIEPDSYIEFMGCFFDLINDGCCMVEGKFSFNESHVAQLTLNDKEALIGDYCANFILPSWLSGQLPT